MRTGATISSPPRCATTSPRRRLVSRPPGWTSPPTRRHQGPADGAALGVVGVALLLTGACQTNSASSRVNGGDTTPPEVSLSVEHAGTSATNGRLALTSKVGKLNLVANAADQESGIQDLQIWMTSITGVCPTTGANPVCAVPSHALVTAPTF